MAIRSRACDRERRLCADSTCLVIDLPDIGSRYYTFQATMLFCLEAAAESGFAGRYPRPAEPAQRRRRSKGRPSSRASRALSAVIPIPTRHGMTLGELAQLVRRGARHRVDLHVVTCEGWKREQYFDETGLPWVLPSPNMPTLDTAIVYPGQCLIEGTNLSEGRGTTRPFEIFGAPWMSPDRVVGPSRSGDFAGVTLRPTMFRPTFQKFAGQVCGGVSVARH